MRYKAELAVKLQYCCMERSLRQIFVENLKYYRRKKNMSQLMLAVELEKSANYINGIENNNTFPSIEMIEQIANILGIPASKLFEEQNRAENVIVFDKARFIKDVSADLYTKIRDDIEKNIESVLSKY